MRVTTMSSKLEGYRIENALIMNFNANISVDMSWQYNQRIEKWHNQSMRNDLILRAADEYSFLNWNIFYFYMLSVFSFGIFCAQKYKSQFGFNPNRSIPLEIRWNLRRKNKSADLPIWQKDRGKWRLRTMCFNGLFYQNVSYETSFIHVYFPCTEFWLYQFVGFDDISIGWNAYD